MSKGRHILPVVDAANVERGEMSKQTEFKKKMEQLFPKGGYNPEEAHPPADILMIEELESLGYDLSDYLEAELWYA